MKTNTSLMVFKIVAWWVAIYHGFLAIIGTFASSDVVVAVATKVYGITPTVSAQFLYMGKFASAYMGAFAVMMGLMALNPEKYRAFIIPAIILFLFRIFDRLVYFDQLHEAFNSSMQQNLATVVLAAVFAFLLYYFRPRTS